jgi:ABC-type multidrug transport system permease subunit
MKSTAGESRLRLKTSSILIAAISAGVLAGIISFLISFIGLTEIYQSILPLVIAVPLALFLAIGREKGFSNLKRIEYLTCLSGGIGALIAEITIYFFLG